MDLADHLQGSVPPNPTPRGQMEAAQSGAEGHKDFLDRMSQLLAQTQQDYQQASKEASERKPNSARRLVRKQDSADNASSTAPPSQQSDGASTSIPATSATAAPSLNVEVPDIAADLQDSHHEGLDQGPTPLPWTPGSDVSHKRTSAAGAEAPPGSPPKKRRGSHMIMAHEEVPPASGGAAKRRGSNSPSAAVIGSAGRSGPQRMWPSPAAAQTPGTASGMAASTPPSQRKTAAQGFTSPSPALQPRQPSRHQAADPQDRKAEWNVHENRIRDGEVEESAAQLEASRPPLQEHALYAAMPKALAHARLQQDVRALTAAVTAQLKQLSLRRSNLDRASSGWSSGFSTARGNPSISKWASNSTETFAAVQSNPVYDTLSEGEPGSPRPGADAMSVRGEASGLQASPRQQAVERLKALHLRRSNSPVATPRQAAPADRLPDSHAEDAAVESSSQDTEDEDGRHAPTFLRRTSRNLPMKPSKDWSTVSPRTRTRLEQQYMPVKKKGHSRRSSGGGGIPAYKPAQQPPEQGIAAAPASTHAFGSASTHRIRQDQPWQTGFAALANNGAVSEGARPDCKRTAAVPADAPAWPLDNLLGQVTDLLNAVSGILCDPFRARLPLMGKSWKNRSHARTGYPYSHMRIAHVHIVQPRVRAENGNSYFVGLFMESQCTEGGACRDAQLSKSDCSLELKRLAFLQSYSAFYSSRMAALYRTSRSRVPGALQPGLEAFEGAVSSISTPVLQAVQLRSGQLLTTVDRKLDVACHAAHAWFFPKPANRARALGFNEGWSKVVASSPAVTKLLERAQPSLDAVAARYMGAHDSIVASEAYSNALQSAHEVISSVQGTPVFAAIFPVISPTWEAIAHSTYYESLLNHLKPIKADRMQPPEQMPPALAAQ
ncbi:hypothetical protein WJX73_009072 [Symbiochloris irregularis]|uniref:Uncharacterized protein n=1 Tax=Symbiochloris irregularis TaxID=706552 RepID=A0AAW1NWW9_9CHLO